MKDLMGELADMATVIKTIGTGGGRDFSTVTLWENDLTNTATYSNGDDAIGECYNDSVFTDRVTFAQSTIAFNTVTLRPASGERHDGTIGTGVELDWDSIAGQILGNLNTTGYATIEGIVFDGEYSSSTLDMAYVMRITAGDWKLLGCIINKKRWGKSSGTPVGINDNGGNNTVIANNIVQNCGRYTGSTLNYVAGYAIRNDNSSSHNAEYYNNTMFAGYIGFNASAIINNYVKNNIVADMDSVDYSWPGVGVTHDYNISNDSTATGANSITGVSTSSLFVSTVYGSEDLHIKEGCVAQDSGVDLGSTPDGIQYDIDGLDRTLIDSWDIGADEVGLPIFNFNSAPSAFISSSLTYPSTARLFTSGPVVNSENRNLYTAGPIVFSNEQDNEPLFVSGPNPETVNINSFTAGPYPSSGNFPTRIISGGEPNEGTTLYVQSPLTDGGGGDVADIAGQLYTKGTAFNVDTAKGMPVYLEAPGLDTSYADSPLFIQTRSETPIAGSGIFPTYIGVDPAITTDAGAEILTTQAVAFVSGSNVSMVYEGFNTNSTLFIESTEHYNQDFDLFIRSPKADAMTAFVYNYATDDNIFSMTVDGGGIPNSGNFSMFVSPPTAKTLNIHMNGYLE